MEALTERQAQILDFIVGFLKRNEYPPTRAEIAKAFKLRRQSVQQHLDALADKGRITWTKNTARSIRVLKEI